MYRTPERPQPVKIILNAEEVLHICKDYLTKTGKIPKDEKCVCTLPNGFSPKSELVGFTYSLLDEETK